MTKNTGTSYDTILLRKLLDCLYEDAALRFYSADSDARSYYAGRLSAFTTARDLMWHVKDGNKDRSHTSFAGAQGRSRGAIWMSADAIKETFSKSIADAIFTDRLRHNFQDVYDQGKTDPDIASALGVPVDVVKSWRKLNGLQPNKKS